MAWCDNHINTNKIKMETSLKVQNLFRRTGSLMHLAFIIYQHKYSVHVWQMTILTKKQEDYL